VIARSPGIESNDYAAAARRMEEHLLHVLVDEDGWLAGIASARDLLGAYVTSVD
jgi:hypothetical protein